MSIKTTMKYSYTTNNNQILKTQKYQVFRMCRISELHTLLVAMEIGTLGNNLTSSKIGMQVHSCGVDCVMYLKVNVNVAIDIDRHAHTNKQQLKQNNIHLKRLRRKECH